MSGGTLELDGSTIANTESTAVRTVAPWARRVAVEVAVVTRCVPRNAYGSERTGRGGRRFERPLQSHAALC